MIYLKSIKIATYNRKENYTHGNFLKFSSVYLRTRKRVEKRAVTSVLAPKIAIF